MADNHYSEQEFIRLFRQYSKPVHAYIQTITGDQHAAEELTQELFIKLWKRKDSYGSINNIDQYIMRMAYNASMSWFKKLALDARLAAEVKRRMNMDHNDVEDHVLHQEAKQLLDKALATLSPQRRKVFELSRKEGMKLPEIAALMHISPHTANHHLVAALAQIRQFFLEQNNRDKALLLLLLAFIE